MRSSINKLLGAVNLRLERKSSYEKLRASYEALLSQQSKYRDYELAELIEPKHLPQYFECLPLSKAQLRQDLFVLCELDFKREGYFVEFGATNGIDLSNSYLLETKFGWNGILAEPAKKWHAALQQNRSASIETDCVWKSSGETLIFNEVQEGELSTLDAFSNSDHHRETRKDGEKYEIDTISLNDLLEKYSAPFSMDYLSIDTEGSELDILQAFDFEKHTFRVITCEHNYTSSRNDIYDLLTGVGYERKFEEQSLWDDWYVLGSR